MRYFLAFLVTFGLILVLFLLLFHSGSSKPVTGGRTLDSYAATDALARLTIDGPIVADQNYQSIQVSVSSSDVTFEQLQGYQGAVVNQQSFANNDIAYTNFLFALEKAGFTKGNISPSLKDERGYCPLGDRYIIEFMQDGQDKERYWATSCGGTKTYLGALGLTMALFQAQVPNYGTLSKNAAL